MANDRTAADFLSRADVECDANRHEDFGAACSKCAFAALLAYGAQERRRALEEAEAVVLLLARARKMPGVSAILASNSIRALARDTKAGG